MTPSPTIRSQFWWTLYAAAFGYVEALVVVYIRRLGQMPPGLDYPAIWSVHHLSWNGAAILTEMRRLGVYQTEYTREIATLLLLLGPAMAAGRTGRERLGLYLYTFAVWDETFYLWLKLWIGFPQSLTSTDIYFLVPIAWYGPVWFPVLIVMPLLIVLSLWLMGRVVTHLLASFVPRRPSRGFIGGSGRVKSFRQAKQYTSSSSRFPQ